MITFKKGDKVKFLNDVGGGIVTRIDNKTVYVENEDGFEVPSAISQLLKVEVSQDELSPFTKTVPLASKQTTDAENITVKPIIEPAEDYIDLAVEADEANETNSPVSVNILLGWVAQRKKNGKTVYVIYLVNDCSYSIMYVASMVKGATFCGIQAGMLESDTTIHITEISADDLKNVKSLRFDIVFFKKGSYLPHEPISYVLKTDEFYLTDPVNYVKNPYFDEKALIYNISEEHLMNEIENVASDLQKQFEIQKKQVDAPSLPVTPKKTAETDTEEVDLHIEQLVDYDPKKLSQAEMLDIQMAKFNAALEEAIRNRKKRIIFIHGVGKGRLRLEIQRNLNKKYPKLRYQDASFKEYGFGATLVMI